MEIGSLSSRYHVRRLDEDDVEAVLALCRRNSLYYEHCPPFVTPESIRHDMQALPQGKSLDDKYYVGYFDGEKLIAVIDLIAACPDAATAFIGFFMVDVSAQKKGTGSGIIDELCAYLTKAGYQKVRLGWVKGNPQPEHFWHKNGFVETGLMYDTDRYTVVVAQRELA